MGNARRRRRTRKQGTRPIRQRSGTRLDHRYTQRVYERGRHVGFIDTKNSVYQFGGPLERHFMRIYDSMMLGLNEWRVCDDFAETIEFIEEPGSGECWVSTIDLLRRHGAQIETQIGPRFAVRRLAWDIYAVNGELIENNNPDLAVPGWAQLRRAGQREDPHHYPGCKQDEDCMCLLTDAD